jgi:2-polyprenyl-6-hydroxyphenyl methylase/3-demethylubiquinone-9 3-methyltransferase
MPARLHVWEMFVKPAELESALARHGLENRGLIGLKPRENPILLLALLRKLKRGAIDLPEFSRHAVFEEAQNTSVSYMGYAIKRLGVAEPSLSSTGIPTLP